MSYAVWMLGCGFASVIFDVMFAEVLWIQKLNLLAVSPSCDRAFVACQHEVHVYGIEPDYSLRQPAITQIHLTVHGV